MNIYDHELQMMHIKMNEKQADTVNIPELIIYYMRIICLLHFFKMYKQKKKCIVQMKIKQFCENIILLLIRCLKY